MSSTRFEYLLRPPPHELEEDGVVPWHVGPGRVGGDGLAKVHVRLGDGDLGAGARLEGGRLVRGLLHLEWKGKGNDCSKLVNSGRGTKFTLSFAE